MEVEKIIHFKINL